MPNAHARTIARLTRLLAASESRGERQKRTIKNLRTQIRGLKKTGDKLFWRTQEEPLGD